MPIDTEERYNPKMKCPLYVKLTYERFNDYTLFNEYSIRIPDEENGEDGPYYYVFDTVLVAKQTVKWSEIPNIVTAYVAKTRDAQTAIERIHPLGEEGEFEPDEELLLLVFLRIGEAKEYIMSDDEVLSAQEADINIVGEYGGE